MREVKVKGFLELGRDLVMVAFEDNKANRLSFISKFYIASLISLALSKKDMGIDYPLTHDLFLQMLGRIQARITGVYITDYNEKGFLTELEIQDAEGVHTLKSGIEDAFILAAKQNVPIYAEDDVFEKYYEAVKKAEEKAQQAYLENIPPLNSEKI